MRFRAFLNAISNKDQAVHAWITGRFPKVMPIVDSILELVFDKATHAAFSFIAACLLLVLGATGVIDTIVAVAIASA
jgi:putative Mn2+ efflux pump MntP